ncbi:MAG: sulfurtransferase TusA family protein [Candidatus Odinarchaeota archaeon]|nr:sulfurtransferase TusA family protein [Candidatus Odinarchaeota archaeon]
MSEDLSNIKPDKTVDARGVSCPGPLLAAKRSITEIPVGGVLEVLSSDPGTVKDLPLWAKKVGHEYLGTIEEPGYWKLYIRRKK